MNRNRLFSLPFLLSILFLLSFLGNYSSARAQEDPFVVVLDAGHGGHDPGNLGNGYLEKNIALNIVLRAGGILEQNSDVKVIYTRNNDTFVDLFVRGEIANKANANLFVSVHCDSHTSDAHGAGTFVLGLHANEQNFSIAKKENSVIYLEDNYAVRYADYDINSPESIIGLTIMQEEFLDQSVALATEIQNNFSSKLKRKDRKVKQAGFIVLHQTFMPSVLVETGFLTNMNEGAYLNSVKGQSEMGAAIANAILDYKVKSIANVGQGSMSSMPSAPNPEDVVFETTATKSINSEIAKVPEELPELVEELPAVVEEKPNDKVAEMINEAEIRTVESLKSNSKNEIVSDSGKKNVEPKNTMSKTTGVETPKIIEEVVEVNTEVVLKEVNIAGRPKIVTEEIKSAETPITETVASVKEVQVEPEKITQEVQESTLVTVSEEVSNKPKANIEFRVQLMASAKNLPSDAAVFKGLKEISKEPYKNLYRYMLGNSNDYVKVQLQKKVAIAKGFSTCYLVAYKDGVRIDVEEARKYTAE